MGDILEEPESNRFSDEQKIVAAVWVHERHYNNQTWEDIYNNFKIRFNMTPPMRSTFLSWERKLFNSGNVRNKDKSGRPIARLMHVPYVKASLKENPHMSLRERAKELGLPRTTLLKILQEDLNMGFEINMNDKNQNKRHVANNNGMWKKVEENEESLEEAKACCEEFIDRVPEIKEEIVENAIGSYEGSNVPSENLKLDYIVKKYSSVKSEPGIDDQAELTN